MGLLACSFVFLPFSEPARVLNSPVFLLWTSHSKGSEFACLPRKVSQLTEVENTAEASMFSKLLSVNIILHYRDTWGDTCAPDAPFNSKTSSPIVPSSGCMAVPKPYIPSHQSPPSFHATFLGHWNRCSTTGCKPSSAGRWPDCRQQHQCKEIK